MENTGGAPDIRSTIKTTGYQQCSTLKDTSNALIRVELTKFVQDLFPSQSVDLQNLTFFVLDRNSENQTASRWTALLLHSTNQIFLKPPSSLDERFQETLVELLDFSEALGVADVFVCVPRSQKDSSTMIELLRHLDFTVLPQQTQPSKDLTVLRFQF
jgi:hypothetical protein